VAVDLASRQKVAGLVLEGTFSNVADMAKTVYPWLPAAVLSSRFDSISKIALVRAPKLQLHAQDDDIVPFDLGKRLYETAGEPKTLVVLVGGHNDAFFISGQKVHAALREFIDKIISSPR
jgi:hypothetical protein